MKMTHEWYKQKFGIPWYEDVHPLHQQDELPPRINGEDREIPESLYKLDLFGKNRNPFRLNYDWYEIVPIQNRLSNDCVFHKFNEFV